MKKFLVLVMVSCIFLMCSCDPNAGMNANRPDSKTLESYFSETRDGLPAQTEAQAQVTELVEGNLH